MHQKDLEEALGDETINLFNESRTFSTSFAGQTSIDRYWHKIFGENICGCIGIWLRHCSGYVILYYDRADIKKIWNVSDNFGI